MTCKLIALAVMRTLSRWLLASILFLLYALGWLGDSLLSVLIRRPRLSFLEVQIMETPQLSAVVTISNMK